MGSKRDLLNHTFGFFCWLQPSNSTNAGVINEACHSKTCNIARPHLISTPLWAKTHSLLVCPHNKWCKK